MLARFQQLGLANAHQEAWSIANRWTRGPATGRVFLSADTKPGEAPTSLNLTMATGGWSPATEGTVKGPVVGVAVEKVEDLQQYKGKLKGAIIVLNRPVEMQPPRNPVLTPWGEETIPIAFPKSDKPFDFAAYMKLRTAELTFFAEEKAAAVLLGSEKWFGLLNMSISGQNYQPGVIPTAYIAREDFMLLWRLLDSGPVQAEVNIGGNFSGKPAEVYNTVAEIPGSEKPDEVVIIGAHLDSWDLATGATDNGTGSTAVLEAARALKKSGVKPKRTIRFVLFTGEEQGLNGSKAYVAKHQDELKKISAVLVHDSGTGKVLTIGLMGNYDARETIDRVMYPLARAKEIGLAEPTLRKEDGSDHVPFDEAGVPRLLVCARNCRLRQNAPFASRHCGPRALGRFGRGRPGVGGICVQRSRVAGVIAAKIAEAVVHGRHRSQATGEFHNLCERYCNASAAPALRLKIES